MTHRACSEQPDILTAAAEAREIPAAFAAHLASCPSCREQVDAVTFLRGLAAAPVASHPLPDPAVIWWKAQLLRRWQAERAASAPIERMRWIELAAGFASLAVFLAWQWQGLVNLVVARDSGRSRGGFRGPPGRQPDGACAHHARDGVDRGHGSCGPASEAERHQLISRDSGLGTRGSRLGRSDSCSDFRKASCGVTDESRIPNPESRSKISPSCARSRSASAASAASSAKR